MAIKGLNKLMAPNHFYISASTLLTRCWCSPGTTAAGLGRTSGWRLVLVAEYISLYYNIGNFLPLTVFYKDLKKKVKVINNRIIKTCKRPQHTCGVYALYSCKCLLHSIGNSTQPEVVE